MMHTDFESLELDLRATEMAVFLDTLAWPPLGFEDARDPLQDLISDPARVRRLLPLAVPLLHDACRDRGIEEDLAWLRVTELVKRLQLRDDAVAEAIVDTLRRRLVQDPVARGRAWYAARAAGFVIYIAEIEAERSLRAVAHGLWLDLICSVASPAKAAALYLEAVRERRLSWKATFDRVRPMQRRLAADEFTCWLADVAEAMGPEDAQTLVRAVDSVFKLGLQVELAARRRQRLHGRTDPVPSTVVLLEYRSSARALKNGPASNLDRRGRPAAASSKSDIRIMSTLQVKPLAMELVQNRDYYAGELQQA